MNLCDGFVAETPPSQSYEVDSCVADRFLSCNDVGRNVLACSGTALHHHVTSHAYELVEENCCGNDGVVVDNHFACEFCGISNDTTVANDAIVCNMHILHQQVVVAHDGCSFGSCSA